MICMSPWRPFDVVIENALQRAISHVLWKNIILFFDVFCNLIIPSEHFSLLLNNLHEHNERLRFSTHIRYIEFAFGAKFS